MASNVENIITVVWSWTPCCPTQGYQEFLLSLGTFTTLVGRIDSFLFCVEEAMKAGGGGGHLVSISSWVEDRISVILKPCWPTFALI